MPVASGRLRVLRDFGFAGEVANRVGHGGC